MIQLKNKLLLLLLLPITALALSSDQHKIAYLNSDQATYNHQTRISTYIDNVFFKQGTARLRADKLMVYNNKNNKIYKMVAFGNRAHYSTLPDGKKNRLNAKANTIEFYPQKNTAILIGNAEVTQQGNKMHGPRITYNIKKQTVLLSPSSKNQVKITFQP